MGRLAWAAAFVAISCGGETETPTRVCAPGQQIECACPAGAKGAQACKDDGSGYEYCDCSGGSGGTGGASGSGGAGGAPIVDADVDRFDAPESGPMGSCTSGMRWIGGNTASAVMTPGQACMGPGCHSGTSRTPMTMAGTIYPFGGERDDNDCNGMDGAGVAVVPLDEMGNELPGVGRIQVNSVGNFYTNRMLPPSYKVKVLAFGREALMVAPVTNGDCNFCHQAVDFMGAKSRIVPKAP